MKRYFCVECQAHRRARQRPAYDTCNWHAYGSRAAYVQAQRQQAASPVTVTPKATFKRKPKPGRQRQQEVA